MRRHTAHYLYRGLIDRVVLFATIETKTFNTNLKCGEDIVRLKICATKDAISNNVGLECFITEINGKPVSDDDQLEKSEKTCIMYGEEASQEDQAMFVQRALGKFGIHGNPIAVSDEYVLSYLRILDFKSEL